MDKITAQDVVNGKSFEMWVNSLKKAEILTAQADSEIQVDKVPIAGQLADEDIETGATGNGSLGFHKVLDDSLIKDVNEAFKKNQRFVFDLRGTFENKNTGSAQTVIITDCKINKFSPLAVDITKLLTDNFNFSYSPKNVEII